MDEMDDLDERDDLDDEQDLRGQRLLPAPARMISREQLFAAGGTLLTTGLIDVATHFNPTTAFIGALATFVAFRHGKDVIQALVPGSDAAGVVGSTERFVARMAPTTAHDVEDQAVSAKLKRLLGLRALTGSDRPSVEPVVVDADADRRALPAGRNGENPDTLFLGARLRPHASSILSKRIGLFGVPGSGKSNGLAVFVEEIGRLQGVGVPFILADTEGENASLLSPKYLMRPYQAGAHNVTPENAFAFGQSVLERGRQVVLNLPSYGDDDVAALVMIEILRGMFAWSEERENSERVACMFLLDEAAFWLPQRVEESTLSREKDENGQTLLAYLQHTLFDTVRRGRKRGIGFLFATQRPADLDKRAISCDWLILFRQTFPNDLNKYAELGVPKDAAQALAAGEAFVIDPRGVPTVYQFRRRSSPDNAQTPGLASLQKHRQRWSSWDEDAQGSAGSGVQRMEDLPQRVSDPSPVSRKLSRLHQLALEHYQPGMSYRQLGELVGVGKDKAGELIKELKRWGYLEEEEH